MRFIALVILLVSFSASANITEGGRGMLFGQDHAFAVTAAPNWVLDNESAVNQRLHMVFYPIGGTWSNSPVIVYGRAVPVTHAMTIKSQVEQTVSDFHKNGSPNYSSKAKPSLALPNGRKAEIYYYAGDRWGNYEAVAYIQETRTINYLVFNSRTKENFEKYIGDFQKIVSSYQNLYTTPAKFPIVTQEKLERESSSLLSKAGGKEYESKAIQAVGNNMASAMQDCTSYLHGKQLPGFSYFVRIAGDGRITESYIFPANALSECFNGLMAGAKYPTHTFGSFVLNIEMNVSP